MNEAEELRKAEAEVKKAWNQVKKRWEVINKLQFPEHPETPDVIFLANETYTSLKD